jgi:hypothetical protein
VAGDIAHKDRERNQSNPEIEWLGWIIAACRTGLAIVLYQTKACKIVSPDRKKSLPLLRVRPARAGLSCECLHAPAKQCMFADAVL